jgi:hypothetical protein
VMQIAAAVQANSDIDRTTRCNANRRFRTLRPEI